MKKFKRLAVLGISVVLACGAVALSACSEGNDETTKVPNQSNSEYIEVDEKLWNERLSLTSIDSCTLKDEKYINNKIEYKPLEEKFDFKNKIYYESTWSWDGSTDSYYDIYEYVFSYKDKYYAYDSIYLVRELDKEDFDDYFDLSDYIVSYMPTYEECEYNSETGKYEKTVEIPTPNGETPKIYSGISFPKAGGFEIILNHEIITDQKNFQHVKMYTENINSTVVTVPQSVYDAVDKYIAEQANKTE